MLNFREMEMALLLRVKLLTLLHKSHDAGAIVEDIFLVDFQALGCFATVVLEMLLHCTVYLQFSTAASKIEISGCKAHIPILGNIQWVIGTSIKNTHILHCCNIYVSAFSR